MTKAELIKVLEIFDDNAEIVVVHTFKKREYKIIQVGYNIGHNEREELKISLAISFTNQIP